MTMTMTVQSRIREIKKHKSWIILTSWPELRREPLAKLQPKGSNELVHSMVCSGCVQAVFPFGGSLKEEVVYPPKELSSTAAPHIGAGLIQNIENLSGMPFGQCLEEIGSRFRALNFIFVADSYSANVRFIQQLFSYLTHVAGQKEEMPVITGVFTTCFLHQLARVLALHIDHHSLTAPLYSITRLNIHSNARELILKTMKLLLRQRFEYRPNEAPPDTFMQSAAVKAKLLDVLGGTWTGEADADDATTLTSRQLLLRDALMFFNGDILQDSKYTHYCQGCHRNASHALEDATLLGLDGHQFPDFQEFEIGSS